MASARIWDFASVAIWNKIKYAMKIFTGFKKLTTIAITVLCFLAGANWAVPAGTEYQQPLVQKRPRQPSVMVAQNETRTTTGEKTAPNSEGSASESKTREQKESKETREKPRKEFRPSERIEAEQAVDFPYDI